MFRALQIPVVALALAIGLQTASAQAPTLDVLMKETIQSMTVINDQKMPVLKDRAVVVTFFASWCPPCRPEFGELNTLRQAFAEDDLSIIAINRFEGHFEDKNGHRMKRFMAATQPAFAVLQPDTDGGHHGVFEEVSRIPTVYIYDRTGQPVYTFIHERGATKMHATAAEIIPHVHEALSLATQP